MSLLARTLDSKSTTAEDLGFAELEAVARGEKRLSEPLYRKREKERERKSHPLRFSPPPRSTCGFCEGAAFALSCEEGSVRSFAFGGNPTAKARKMGDFSSSRKRERCVLVAGEASDDSLPAVQTCVSEGGDGRAPLQKVALSSDGLSVAFHPTLPGVLAASLVSGGVEIHSLPEESQLQLHLQQKRRQRAERRRVLKSEAKENARASATADLGDSCSENEEQDSEEEEDEESDLRYLDADLADVETLVHNFSPHRNSCRIVEFWGEGAGRPLSLRSS